MCQFIETLKVYNDVIYHLNWHQKRVNKTFARFYPNREPWQLDILFNNITTQNTGLYKLKMIYDDEQYQISLNPYAQKSVKSFEFKEIDFLYDFKYEDRSAIDAAVDNVLADEVIFTYHGQLLDASYANIALFDGQKWWTPTTFLLNGTTRQRLLFENKIFEKKISVEDIKSYKKISFINALNDLDERSIKLDY